MENVLVPLSLAGSNTKEAKFQATQLLKQLGLSERKQHVPAALSGGEKQRLAIVRALITNPKLILADEPTGNLDSESGHQVMELLKKVAKKENRAVIIVSHDQRLLDIADRVLWMEDGRIKEGHENLVLDPVCEMTLQQALAPYSLTHQGQIYYFCSQKCLEEFKKQVTPEEL